MKYISLLIGLALCVSMLISVNACAEFTTRLDAESIESIRDAVGTGASEVSDIILTGDTTLTEESAQTIADGIATAITTAGEVGIGATGLPFDLSGTETILASLIVGFLSRMGYVKVKESGPGKIFG